MLRFLPTRKAGVCITLIAAYTFLVAVMVRRLGQDESPVQIRHFSSNSYITDCITGKIIGRIPDDMKTELFDDEKIGEAVETSEQRREFFRKIFNNREWGSGVDKAYQGIQSSGRDSTLRAAQEAIAGLHTIIGEFKMKTGASRVRLVDVPCGDVAWMSRFLKTRDDIDYTGIDIVPELIDNHTQSFQKYPWKFRLQDIAEQPLNESYDIILCRLALVSLYTRDIIKILKMFSDSGSRYLLTTTFSTFSENPDLPKKLKRGRYRPLNFEIPPISLTPPKCMFEDGEPGPAKDDIQFLGLWDLPLRKISDCSNQTSFLLPGRNFTVYSCISWAYNSQP